MDFLLTWDTIEHFLHFFSLGILSENWSLNILLCLLLNWMLFKVLVSTQKSLDWFFPQLTCPVSKWLAFVNEFLSGLFKLFKNDKSLEILNVFSRVFLDKERLDWDLIRVRLVKGAFLLFFKLCLSEKSVGTPLEILRSLVVIDPFFCMRSLFWELCLIILFFILFLTWDLADLIILNF